MSQIPTETHEKIRILHCHDCGTLEEIPDFDGPPEYDVLLEYTLSQHETNGHRHIGKLYDVEKRVWELQNLRHTIIDQIKGGGSSGLAAFDDTYYDTRNNFQEDALRCFSLHLRPTEGCPDYRADSKRLLPATKADRKEVGLTMEGAPKQYLCSFCPVQSHVEKKSRGD